MLTMDLSPCQSPAQGFALAWIKHLVLTGYCAIQNTAGLGGIKMFSLKKNSSQEPTALPGDEFKLNGWYK